MDIEALIAYLPMDRRHALASGRPLPDRAQGVALFADIAGFTPLTDSLITHLGPRRGAEDLTRLLNMVYDSLIAEVHRFGGSVIGFSGDGFVAWFNGAACPQAVACGLALQHAVSLHRTCPMVEGETTTLSLKVSIAAGPVRRFLAGDPQVQLLDVLAGATVDRMALAEEMANQGEIIVGPEAARQLGSRLLVVEWRDQFAVAAGLDGAAAHDPWPETPIQGLAIEELRPYLLPPVYARLMAGHGDFLAELRPVAALFLRLGGLDYDRDDDAGHKLDAYVRWVQQTLAHYGGHLLQLTTGEKGSFLYASFGALEAHEDDAERALSAAWALRQPPADIAFPTAVQIGLSQGRVRAGAYGARTRRCYGAIGNQINIAARLMQAAPAGEILCSPRIECAAASHWTFEALAPLRVKGQSEPLRVYVPLGPTQARVHSEAQPLIGRQAECQLMARMLKGASLGRRQILLLEGEAGIGKSRLVSELALRACEKGIPWFMGAAFSVEQKTPYRAWRELLGGFFGLKDKGPQESQAWVREQIAAVDPSLAERAPLLDDILQLDQADTPMIRAFDPKQRHESLIALVIDLFRAATADRPLALVLEDAHWLDPFSWELALSVARALADRPLFLLFALRPMPEPLCAEYETLSSVEGTETLHLEAMPIAETVALAASRFGVSPDALPPEVIDLVGDRAGGNPFFAEEMAYTLRDSGALTITEDGCSLAADATTLDAEVPDTIEGLVLSRIDRLPPQEKVTLKVAAVIGRSFLYRTLHAVHPQQVIEDLLHAHLADLARRDLTPLETLDPELTYLFKHIITQQVAYDTLLFAQRRDLHRRVARWYEQAYAGNLSPYFPLLVHHWCSAEDLERERHYAKVAGEQAAAQFANLEAVTYLGRALDLTPEGDRAERYALLQTRARVHHLGGDRVAQKMDIDSLKALAEDIDDDARRADVALLRADYSEITSDYAAAIDAAQEAVRLARAVGDARTEAASHLCWGRALWRQAEYETARARIEQALTLAQDIRARAVEADCQINLGVVNRYMGNNAAARKHYERALEIYRTSRDRWGEAAALGNLGAISYVQEDYAGSRDYLERSLRIRHDIGDRRGEGLVVGNLAVLYEFLGQYDEAAEYYDRALRISREVGNRRGECWYLADLGLFYHELGNNEKALDYCQRALSIAQQLGDAHVEGQAWANLARTWVDLERFEEAITGFHKALAVWRGAGEEHFLVEPTAGLADALMRQGKLAQALDQVEEILMFLETNSLDIEADPFRVTWICYQVLDANGDRRAADILSQAHGLLQAQATKLEDKELQLSFVENVAARREIALAHRATMAPGPDN